MLRLETIEPKTLSLLKRIQRLPELEDTRLVGGTALAMQLGHRLTDERFFNTVRADYGTIVWDDNIDVAPESVWERSVIAGKASVKR